jgi:hypothetical protein
VCTFFDELIDITFSSDSTCIDRNSDPVNGDILLEELGRIEALLEPWEVACFVAEELATSLTSGSVYGCMFDTQPPRHRQGFAVFRKTVEHSTRTDKDLMLARTVAHEIGHALNLSHEDATTSTAASIAHEIMGEIPWSDNSLEASRFGRHSRNHLSICLANSPDDVRPGSAVPFQARTCCKTPYGAWLEPTSGSILSAGRGPVSVELGVQPCLAFRKRRAGVHVQGEPLRIGLKIANQSNEAVRVPKRIGSAWHNLRIYMESIGDEGTPSDVRSLTPPLSLCGGAEKEARLLAPGQVIRLSELLSYRGGSPVLDRSGRFLISADLALASGRVRSNTVPITVLSPEKKRHERSIEIAKRTSIARSIELEGNSGFSDAETDIEWLLKRNPRFPSVPYLLVQRLRGLLGGDGAPSATGLRRARKTLELLDGCPRLPGPIRSEARHWKFVVDYATASPGKRKEMLEKLPLSCKSHQLRCHVQRVVHHDTREFNCIDKETEI